ncbi:MAG: protein-export chaperone SecB, partial [Sulfuricella sp.]|nr:protein-export chaperone SecB [Sulfuricella sp.]
MSDEQQQPTFSIEKIYVKDLSLEIPHAPTIFMQRETPQIDVQLHNQGGMVDEGVYETVLTVTVTAKLAEDKTLFLVEVAQAGIFQIRNIPEADLEPIL